MPTPARACSCCGPALPNTQCVATIAGGVKEKSRCVFYSACQWNDAQCPDSTDFTCASDFTCENWAADVFWLPFFIGFIITGINYCCIGWLVKRSPKGAPDDADGFAEIMISYTCVQEQGDSRCSRQIRFIKVAAKHIGTILALTYKILGVVSIFNALSELEDIRESANLGSFDNCCSRITNLETACMFVLFFSGGAVLTYLIFCCLTCGNVVDPLKDAHTFVKLCSIVVKNWCAIVACCISLIGALTSKQAAFSWGQGDCPAGGIVEQKMEAVNAEFTAAAWRMLWSILSYIVMIELWYFYESCCPSRNAGPSGHRIAPVEPKETDSRRSSEGSDNSLEGAFDNATPAKPTALAMALQHHNANSNGIQLQQPIQIPNAGAVTGNSAPPPLGIDPSTGKPYWLDPATGQNTWLPPMGPA